MYANIPSGEIEKQNLTITFPLIGNDNCVALPNTVYYLYDFIGGNHVRSQAKRRYRTPDDGHDADRHLPIANIRTTT